MKKLTIAIFMLAAFAMSTFRLFAIAPTNAVHLTPGQINYQGKLVKADGSNVTDGTYTLDIRLYRTATGSSALIWGGRYSTYTKDGFFNIMLGSNAGTAVSGTPPTYKHDELWRALWPDPATPTDQKNTLFLGVTPVAGVAGQLTYNTEIAPRQNLLAAPYAFRAQTAEYANQSFGEFKANGAFSAGYGIGTATALRTYASSSTPCVDIGVGGAGETKLQSATTRITSTQLIVTSPTQSFTSGFGGIAINSGAGNISLSGINANINMSGNVSISGAGSDGTTIGSVSKPLTLQGNQIKGRNELVWNKVSNSTASESPFIVQDFSFTVPAGQNYYYVNLNRAVRDYSAMVVGWRLPQGSDTFRVEPVFTDANGNWQLKIGRQSSGSSASYTISVMFINKQMVTDLRPRLEEG